MTLDEQNYADLKKLVQDQAKQIETLTNAFKKVTEPPPPQKVAWDSGKSLEIDLQAVADGRIIVEQPEPEERQLKDNEIRRTDLRRINAHLKEIADGSMLVVD